MTGRARTDLPALVRAAPPAAIVEWGTLAMVAFTLPIQPYAEGAWDDTRLAALVGMGVVSGALGLGAIGAVGAVVGLAAAIAIQLYGVHGQALGNSGVVASLTEPPWSTTVATSLAVGLAALLVGFAIGAVFRALLEREDGRTVLEPRWPLRLAILVGVIVVAGVAVRALVLDLAGSRYVPPSDQPVIRLEVDGDRIVTGPSPSIPAGIVRLDVSFGRSGTGQFALTRALSAQELADVEAGRLPWGTIQAYRAQGYAPDAVAQTQQSLETPGTYAVVVWVSDPGATGSDRVLDSATFEVVAQPPGAEAAPTRSGGLLGLGALIAIAITAWSAAGTVLVLRRRTSSDDVAIAGVVGVVAAGLAWVLLSFFIDLAANPF